MCHSPARGQEQGGDIKKATLILTPSFLFVFFTSHTSQFCAQIYLKALDTFWRWTSPFFLISSSLFEHNMTKNILKRLTQGHSSWAFQLKGSRKCHPKICRFSIWIILSWGQVRTCRWKKSSLLFPIYLKAGYKFVQVYPAPSIPERTETNHWRELWTLICPEREGNPHS